MVIGQSFKDLVIVGLTFAFVLMYALAIFGIITPLSDVSVVSRLEPIIFVIIGYYFGRIPGEQNEKVLKEEINRQVEKVESAEGELRAMRKPF